MSFGSLVRRYFQRSTVLPPAAKATRPRKLPPAMVHRMLAYAVLLVLAAAGYAGAAAWLVPVAAACLTLADWRPWRLARRACAPWSSKATTYLVSGAIFHLVLATLAFGAGRILHRVLG